MHLTKIVESEGSQHHLCDSCARDWGIDQTFLTPEGRLDLILGVLPIMEAEEDESVRRDYAQQLRIALAQSAARVPENVSAFLDRYPERH